MDWDDLQVLLALSRAGSRAGAARLLRVDVSTIARRMAALEAALDRPLTERDGAGRMVLTEAGRRVAAQAEQMEDHARQIAQVDRPARAWVRVTSVPLVVNHLLLPGVPDFARSHPGIGVELIAEARDLSLAHHDADIALRLARPREGGQAVLARQIGHLHYAAYAARDVVGPLPRIGYDRSMQFLSHAAAIAELAQGSAAAPLAVNDAETLFQAVLSGQGVSLFPREIAGTHPGLRELPVPLDLPVREVWLLIRRDLAQVARVRAVADWLAERLRPGSAPPPDGHAE